MPAVQVVQPAAGARVPHDRGRLSGPDRTGTVRNQFGAIHVVSAARLAQQIPGDAALAARARPARLVRAVAGVTASAAAVTATRVGGEHVIGYGHAEYVTAQLAQHRFLLLIVGHQPPEHPFVVFLGGQFLTAAATAAAAVVDRGRVVHVIVSVTAITVIIAVTIAVVVRRPDSCRRFYRRCGHRCPRRYGFPNSRHRRYYLEHENQS